MATITQEHGPSVTKQVRPSIQAGSQPFTFDQELTPFGTWTSDPIWVPPKDVSAELAKSMLNRFGVFASKDKCWAALTETHRPQFTQVREIELTKASIRLPQARLFVAVTEEKQFDAIEDTIPNCVRTRLEEFLEGPGRQRGVKVYYLKPLCVEVDDELIFTTRDELNAAIAKLQAEVFAEYRRGYLADRAKKWTIGALDASLAFPRAAMKYVLQRKQREIAAYHAKLEFVRRKTALRAARLHEKCRPDGCTFDEMLALTNTPNREDVIEQYVKERELSARQKQTLLMASAATVTLPWFVTLSVSAYYLAAAAFSASMVVAPPVVACDPAFVAEMPGSNGVVLKIGHFDEVRGVTHVEI